MYRTPGKRASPNYKLTAVSNESCCIEKSNDGVTSRKISSEPPAGITREGFVRNPVKSRCW